MRIAQIAPLVERVPPKCYGGTERIVHALTEELVRRGHDVTLFASGDSLTSARLRSVYPRSLRESKLKNIYGMNSWSLLNCAIAYEMHENFDIVHDHTGVLSLPLAHLSRARSVVTMHGEFTADILPLFRALRRPRVVTISRAQLPGARGINHAGVVYNGLPLRRFAFSERPGDYLLYVGRICLNKGVHVAIEVAHALDLPLIIAAKLDEKEEQYFDSYVKPRLSPRVRWIGEVNERERTALMCGARCFLHPALWSEPFGLTLIEAGASGCPVVAFRRGGIPEIVRHGVTGFIVETVEEMIAATEAAGSIDRRACRAHVLSHFNEQRMADGYEAVYRALVRGEHFRSAVAGGVHS